MRLKMSIILIILMGISLFANYTIRTGDVLGLWVFGYPEYSNQKIMVGPDGKITVPPIGRLTAIGKNIEALEKEIKDKISTYIKSPNVTLGIVNYAPFEVQVIGNVRKSGIIQLPKPELSLTKIISLSGGFAEPWKSSYAIVKFPDGTEKKVDITNLFKGLLLENDPIVPENSTIVIPFEFNTNINVYTNFGIKTIPYFNGITLKDVISLSNINPENFENSIIVLRNDEMLNYSFDDLKNNKNITLKKGDTVIFNKLEKYVYVFGLNKSGKIIFDKDEPFTMKTLMAKLGIDPKYITYTIYSKENGKLDNINDDYNLNIGEIIEFESVEKYVYVSSNKGGGKIVFDIKETFDLNTLLGKMGIDKKDYSIEIFNPKTGISSKATKNISLIKGMIIKFTPVEKFVYVNNKGKISFSKTENFDLDTLVGKLGVDKDLTEIRIFDPDTKDTFVATTNISLKNNMYIDFIPVEKFVYVVGDISKTIYFDKKENIDKKTILAKLGLTENNVEHFEYDSLKPGSIITIKIKKNYVYTSGAFNYTGKIDFDISEPITLSAIISKARGFNNSFSGELLLVNKDISKQITIEENKIYNDIIEPGTMIMAKSSRRDVYILGEGIANGVYTAKLNDSLWSILLKAGYVPSEKYEITVKSNNNINTYNGIKAENVLNKTPITNEIYVNVKKVKNDTVLIYKNGSIKVVTPKNKNYVTLIDVFSSVNGFSPSNEGTIVVYNKNEKIAEYNSLDVINNPLSKIPEGSYVNFILDVNLNYITVLGNTTPRSIKSEIPIPLTELLGQLSIDWKTQKYINLYKANGDFEKIDLDKVKNLNTVLIEPGTVVYVPSTHNQYIYVFGEVSKPGVIPYTKGLNVIEALFKAGVRTQTAELSNVFLFTDGPDQPPIVLNLKEFYNGENVPENMNKLLEPGDIIYIPKNILTNVVNVMSIVNNFMSFFNAGYTTYNNINSILGQ
ncbi:polysaccharide biosynthesis/export family protein [Marinitoga sp. 1155]|uniref:polysaccharide biosynthesis/export family protein n=1 Tax=Marinitoga sp. 1155 TaxID=1428448 RepID=UPI0012E01A0B|nr:polysaccharide biosynthesis/export family protein [Marinitoga sp. 1155]